MTRAAPSSCPAKVRAGLAGGKPGNPTPQHVLMELKHRILEALGKLADRDTQQIAVEELDKLVKTLSPDCVSVCLSCLYDSDMQQKSVVKKECVRLFGSIASLHANLLVPHIAKIIASIMRRLRDPDSSVRDACMDAIAILSARMLSPSSSASTGQEKENGTQTASVVTLVTFSSPLFDALNEQNKSVQTGAALCLARVIESAKSPPLGAMARLCPRICKFMSNPNFLARPGLLAVIGSLSQVGALGQQQLALLMPCVQEALESSDWATRKAAAETLSCIGSNLGPALSRFKSTTLCVLESYRFDKVKPVRDSVHDATQLWKTLPGTDSESPGSAKKSDMVVTDGPELAVAMQRLELRSPNPISEEAGPIASESPRNEEKSEILGPNRLLKAVEEPLEAVKKRAPALIDKKLNPEFFQNLAARNADDWQIEVAVPRSCPPSMAQEPEINLIEGNVVIDDRPLGQLSQDKERHSQGSHMVFNGSGRESTGSQSRYLAIYESPLSRSRGLRQMSVRRKEVMDKNMLKSSMSNQSGEANGHVTGLSSNSGLEASQATDERLNWHFVHKHLAQLEQQQSNLMQMFQGFMASSQENMLVLQARVRDLENVEDMMCNVGFSGGKRLNVGFAGHENSGFRPPGRYSPAPEYVNPRFGKSVDSRRLFANRVSASQNMNKGMRHRSFEPALEDWDEFPYRGSRGGLAGAYVFDGQAAGSRHDNMRGPSDLPSNDREDLENDHIGMRRMWDRVPGPVRLGEGPSARSVWQASKDEATLAAIRVAGEDAELSELDALSTTASRLGPSECGPVSLPHKNAGGGGQGKGQYWSLWGSVMEFVHTGDMEAAYTEVLSAEDELMLMRLMSRTKPVLDQLTITTATEVLHAVGQLLQQPRYFDFCLAWIQQVADMVANNGAHCLDLSLDAKKELLMALQESAGMDLPEGWLGNSVDELLQQLANAWTMDIVAVGTGL